MVGAIRAVMQCIECHDAERGALIGAFSYMLERDTPITIAPPSETLAAQ
jgi:hypothetical protein